jgi:hypothetical protein
MIMDVLVVVSGIILNNGETPCQQCCSPGGDCSKAFKGTPGKCCGALNGQAFCCPGLSYRGAASGDAKVGARRMDCFALDGRWHELPISCCI